VLGPDNSTQIFGGMVPGTSQPLFPVSTQQLLHEVTKTQESSGSYSSLQPNPNLVPDYTKSYYPATGSFALTAANAPSLFSDFIGNGTVSLPVSATAYSSVYVSSGNGGGGVLTTASAQVTIQYSFLSVPEPSSVILLGSGIGIGFLATWLRRRAAHPAQSDRT
jgi:hypothetical protein